MTQEIVCLWLSASIRVYSLRQIILFVEHSTMSEERGGNENFRSVDFHTMGNILSAGQHV